MAQGTPLLMMEWDLLSRRSYKVDNGAAELELNKELRWKNGIWNVHSSYYMGNVKSLDNKMDKLVVVIQTQSEYWLASQTCKTSWTDLSTWKKKWWSLGQLHINSMLNWSCRQEGAKCKLFPKTEVLQDVQQILQMLNQSVVVLLPF